MSAKQSNDSEAVAQVAKSGQARMVRDGQWGFMFLLAYIGAAIYFVSESNGTFWGVILGLLQAIVWPVYVVFHLLQMLGA